MNYHYDGKGCQLCEHCTDEDDRARLPHTLEIPTDIDERLPDEITLSCDRCFRSLDDRIVITS